jgi:hypothetical protein
MTGNWFATYSLDHQPETLEYIEKFTFTIVIANACKPRKRKGQMAEAMGPLIAFNERTCVDCE